jgi:hypothetical protein
MILKGGARTVKKNKLLCTALKELCQRYCPLKAANACDRSAITKQPIVTRRECIAENSIIFIVFYDKAPAASFQACTFTDRPSAAASRRTSLRFGNLAWRGRFVL